MKRIKLVVAIASMAVLLVAFSAPAMAIPIHNFKGGSVLGSNFDADVLDNDFGDLDDDFGDAVFDGDGLILVSQNDDDDDDHDFEIIEID